MSQLIFKFPFKITYFENDFYVSSNNFEAYKLIELAGLARQMDKYLWADRMRKNTFVKDT